MVVAENEVEDDVQRVLFHNRFKVTGILALVTGILSGTAGRSEAMFPAPESTDVGVAQMADLRCCTCGGGGDHGAPLRPCYLVADCRHWLHLFCGRALVSVGAPTFELVPICVHHRFEEEAGQEEVAPPSEIGSTEDVLPLCSVLAHLVTDKLLINQLNKVARPAASASSCGAALEQRGGQ